MHSASVTGMMQEIKQIKSDAVTTTTVTKLTDDVKALRVQMSELMNVVTKQLQQSEFNAQVQFSLPNSYATAAKSGGNVSICHQMKRSNNNPTPHKLQIPPVKPVKFVDTALRYCKRLKLQIRADSLAGTLRNKQYNEFCKKCKGHGSLKTSYSATIDANVGDSNIFQMWVDHYKLITTIF